MKFTSTRNQELSVGFDSAVRNCAPADGGVYVPAGIEDFRRWIYYIDDKTPFTSVAGTLSSAFLNEEFSPIICETIATSAFPFEPVVKKLDSNLFVMELFHGFTGCHRDFGLSYLCSYLETTNQLLGKKTVFLDYTSGELGASLVKSLRGKKNLKAVLVYKKGSERGFVDSDCVWNGGNIYPVEMEGSEAAIKAEIKRLFDDKAFVESSGLTVANTTNVGRLMAQVFLFPYAFSRIKENVDNEIFYALDSGNYSTLIAGLYSWRFALPVSGFSVPATAALSTDLKGKPMILDSIVDVSQRDSANPIEPANLERIESFFGKNALMMRNFVFPAEVSERKREEAAKELFRRYGFFADPNTARAYASIRRGKEGFIEDDASYVLVSYNHPSLSADYCRHVLGEVPATPDYIQESLAPYELNRPLISGAAQLRDIISSL